MAMTCPNTSVTSMCWSGPGLCGWMCGSVGAQVSLWVVGLLFVGEVWLLQGIPSGLAASEKGLPPEVPPESAPPDTSSVRSIATPRTEPPPEVPSETAPPEKGPEISIAPLEKLPPALVAPPEKFPPAHVAPTEKVPPDAACVDQGPQSSVRSITVSGLNWLRNNAKRGTSRLNGSQT